MTLLELLIPSLFALAGGFVAGIFARRLEKSKAISFDSDVLLKWTNEFKQRSEKTELALQKAEDRIDLLEKQVEETVKCNSDLQVELDTVKIDREKLQLRVTALETENEQLKKELEQLRNTRKGRKQTNE